MRVKAVILTMGALLLCGGLVQATPVIKDFYADGQIVDGNNFYTVNIWNNATVDMIGGVVTWSINTYDTSTLNISGGDASCFINLHGDNVLNLSGGPDNCWIYPDTSTVNFYGRDLEWIIDSEKRVHGYWADDSEFLITLSRIENATINLYEIPEPCTLGLFGVSLFFLRKRAKILHK